ncbi:MAG: hypothetical protein U0636_11115 [Phycisphaerales bacterium]
MAQFFRFFQDSSCFGLPLSEQAVLSEWRAATGAPRRARTAFDATIDLPNWSTTIPKWVSVDPDVLSTDWYAGLITLGGSGGTGAGFPEFRGYAVPVPDPDESDSESPPPIYCVGLGPDGIQLGDHPSAWVDFAEPMRAVWVELAAAAGTLPCGVRFQHRVQTGGGVQYVTVASMRPAATQCGVVLDLDAIQAGIASNVCVGTFADFGIDRVVFDPADAGAPELTRLVRLEWQTLAAARAPQTVFTRPYRLMEVGSLAPEFDPGVFESENGSAAVKTMWPFTDYRFRLNSARMIAGTYYRAPASGAAGRGLRAALWWPSALGWARLELDESAGAAGVDMVACALSEPFVDSLGERVVMVGGWRRDACSGTVDPSCGRRRPMVWRVRVDSLSSEPLSVETVLVGGGCLTPDSLLDEGVVMDFRVEGPDASGRSVAVGCGAVGMWCGFPGSPGVSATISRTHAAEFKIVSSQSGHACTPRVIHYAEPFVCKPAEGSGPDTGQRWSSTVANSWVKGTIPGQWQRSAVGAWEGDLNCDPESEQSECDRFSSAVQWDWNDVPWVPPAGSNSDAWKDWPRIRAAPAGTRRPVAFVGETDDSGGKKAAPGEPQVMQVFAALGAARWRMEGGTSAHPAVVTSVGWLVDACYDQMECGCRYQAAVFEYQEEAQDCAAMGDTQDPAAPSVGSASPWIPVECLATPIAKPWLVPAPTTDGALRALNLHAAIFSSGYPGEYPVETPFSKASALALQDSGAEHVVRLVLGAAFDRGQFTGQLTIESQRAIIWQGTSGSNAGGPALPSTQWCGRTLNRLVDAAVSPGEPQPLRTWSALESAGYEQYGGFHPAILSGQDITAHGVLVCVSRVLPTRAYQVGLLVPPADMDGSGVVDGTDLGLLLGSWDTADPSADLDASGVVDGTDLGILLGSWGPADVHLDCGATDLVEQDLGVVLVAVQNAGFNDLQQLGASMLCLPPSQAGFLAEYISIAIEVQKGSEP